MSAFVIAMVLWGLANQPAEVVPTLTIEPEIPLARNLMLVEVVTCPSGNFCIVNVKGEEGILGEQVGIAIRGYWSPRTKGSWCQTENTRGRKAAAYLTERLRNADIVALVAAYKRPGSSVIEGRLLVDGYDIADWMIKLGLGAPVGLKVDWCAESPRTLEI
jgi:hypothetical protein